jgi:hypothetical protein
METERGGTRLNVSLQFHEDGLAIETQTVTEKHEVVLDYDLLTQLGNMGEAALRYLIASSHRFHFRRGPDGMLIPGPLSVEKEQLGQEKETDR